MPRLIILLFVAILLPISSQITLPQFLDTTLLRHEILIQGKTDLYSSSLQNGFSNKLFFGGNLTANEISNQVALQDKHNSIGLEANTEIEYRNYTIFPKKNWGMLFKSSANTVNSIHYTKDLFGLVFQGNSAYLGHPMQLNPSSLQSISYIKFGVGFIHKKTKSNFSFNVFQLANYVNSCLDYGAVYVNDSSNLTLIDVTGSSTSYLPKSSQRNIGFGIDLDLKIPITSFNDKKIHLNLIAKNFGIGILTKDVQYYSIDTNYIFQGFTLNQLGTLLSDKTSNTLQDLKIYSNHTMRFTPLLGFIQFDKLNSQDAKTRFQSIFGARMYPSISFIPYVYAGIQIKFTGKIWIGIHENYGITNTLRTGLYVKIIGGKFGFNLGTENLIDSFRSNGKGRSFQCKLQWHI